MSNSHSGSVKFITKMAKKGGENTKKAAGNAKKAENSSKKKQAADQAAEAEEALKWDQGSKKGNKKKEDSEFKKEEAARKKAERDALLKAEEASLPSKPKGNKRGADKVANKKTNKIDDFLDFNSEKPELKATGIDNALEALSLTGKDGGVQVKDFDKHPERRVKAAYLAYEETRMPELRKENPGLRLQQIKQLLSKEFQKSPQNPMNQDTNILYNTSRDEIKDKRQEVREQREKKFA